MSTNAGGGAWGNNNRASSFKSCDALMARLERNELIECTILPTKSFGDVQLDCISAILLTSTKCSSNNLQSLAASGHSVSPDALRRFGKAVAVSQVRSVAIGDSSMRDQGVEAFVQGVLGNDDNDASASLSSETFTSLWLENVDLSYKGMGISGLQTVAKLVKARPSLKRFNLSRNHFCLENDLSLSEQNIAMQTLFCRLQELNLSDCGMDETTARVLIPTFCDTANTACCCLRILRLDHNPIGDEAFETLLHFFNETRLDELYVSNCQLTCRSMKALTTTLKTEQQHFLGVSVLDLSQNNIQLDGLRALAHALIIYDSDPEEVTTSYTFMSTPLSLSKLPNLTTLNLAGNPIGEDRAACDFLVAQLVRRRTLPAELVEHGYNGVIQQPPALICLDWSETGCRIESVLAAVEQAGAIGLRILRLYNLGLRSQGFMQLSKSLRASAGTSSLETLDLAGNGADQSSVVELLSCLLDSIKKDEGALSSLKCLVIGGNQGGENVEAMVREIQQIRPELDIARDKIKKQ